MFTRIRIGTLIQTVVILGIFSPTITVAAEQLDLPMVLQRIHNTYPSFKIAASQVERARQEVIAAESQLGWNLTAQGGYTHDITIYPSVADTTSLGVSVSRQLESGSSLSFGSNVSNADTVAGVSPLADPNLAVDLDLSYRIPLGKGSDNPMYQLAQANSQAGVLMAQASRETSYDQIASQVVELYYAAAQIQFQRENAEKALKRAEALVTFIQNNQRLGLAEEREVLQANAQLRLARLELESVRRLWSKQRTSLNRLMGNDWNQEFSLRVANPVLPAKNYQSLSDEVEQYSPALKRNIAQKMMAEAAIRKAQNDRQSKFDVIASVGNKSRSTVGGGSESGEAYALRFEYQLPMDKSGFDAKLYQARIDQDIAEDNIRQVKDELRYNLAGLIAELSSSEQALKHAHNRLQLERQRFQEVQQRYTRGRADTSQMIMSEGELAFGEFSLQQQQIELAKRLSQLQILRGTFWDVVNGNKE